MGLRVWTHGCKRMVAWAAMALMAVVVPCVVASAAFASISADKPPVMVKVDFGFDGAVPTGRWTPLRVWLSGGEKSESGMIVVEYRQDKTQSARIVVPASTTPGKLSAVDLAVCLPSDPEVKVTFESKESKETLNFGSYSTGTTQRIGEIMTGNRGLITRVGAASLERAFPHASRVESTLTVNKLTIEPRVIARDPRLLTIAKWQKLASADLRPENMSPLARAYDGIDALVVQPNKLVAADARVVGAVREWVDSGGRLVLLVPEDGAAWRMWLASSGGQDLVDIANLNETPVPPDAAKVVAGKVASITASGTEPSKENVYVYGLHDDPKVEIEESPTSYQARASIKARVITPTPGAVRDGWTSRWGGLIAEGPVGMGWVTIIGCDPETIPATLDNTATQLVWQDAMSNVLEPYLKRAPSERSTWETPVNRVLNQIVTVTEPDNTIFYAILGGLVVLMLLLGPFDFFVLKRYNARQRSWATALLWISIATVLAVVVPPNLRTGRSQHNRLAVIDTIQSTNSLGSSGRSWMTGVSGVFGASKILLHPDAQVDGSWWHGVSDTGEEHLQQFMAMRRGRSSTRGQVFGALTTLQIASAEGGERQNVPTDFGVALWTYRAILDEGKARSTVRAAIEAQGDQLAIRVGPFPKETIPGSGRVLIAAGSSPIVWSEPTVLPTGMVELRGTVALTKAAGPLAPTPGASTSAAASANTESEFLPGAADRTASILSRVKGGQWDAILLTVTGPGVGGGLFSDATLATDFERTGTASYRILVPRAPSSQAGTSTENRQ